MSNVSIYEKNWIDLVFEDKNKAYGAYQLRHENSKTTLFALFSGILFLFSLIGLWLLLSSFGVKSDPKPIDEITTIVNISDYHPPKSESSKPKTPSTPAAQALPNKFKKYEASITSDDNEIQVTATIPLTPTASGNGTETSQALTTPTTGGETAIPVAAPFNGPVSATELDRLPEYPGGIKKFYEYVGSNFEKPDVDENAIALSVIMSFVIEKDGSMSSIKVLRSSDKNLETEAIRVLKSLKIKWSPGYKDGDKMRTLLTLPIKVAL